MLETSSSNESEVRNRVVRLGLLVDVFGHGLVLTTAACAVVGHDYETTKTVGCSRSNITKANVALAEPTPTLESHARPLQPRFDPNPVCRPVYVDDVIIIPADPEDTLDILTRLSETMQGGASLMGRTKVVTASYGANYHFTSFFSLSELAMDIFGDI